MLKVFKVQKGQNLSTEVVKSKDRVLQRRRSFINYSRAKRNFCSTKETLCDKLA